jgi:hypothetical protein
MKDFLSGWNLRRTFYLLGGIWMIAQSVMDRMWIFIPFGIYFVAMAVLKFGCASGNCEIPYQKEKEPQN